MASKERKQQRLADSALKRARALSHIDTRHEYRTLPLGAVPADPTQLAHNNTYGRLPRFYLDRIITCRKCGKEEIWPAERQKWWYEVAKGNINTQAVYCRACRNENKAKKAEARKIHLDGMARQRKRRARGPQTDL
jgi:Probable zinc-ribbon domain